MKAKRILALLLMSATLAAMTAGCSGDGGSNTDQNVTTQQADETTTEAAVVERDIIGELETKDFGGATYTMIGVDYATRRNFANEEEKGEIVNDALAQRDLDAEEMLGISIETIPVAGSGDVTTKVNQTVTAGDSAYDLAIAAISGSLVTLMSGNVLYDLSELDALTLDEAWWSPGMYENTRIGNAQYLTTGDISQMKYYAPYCIAYNQKLSDDYGHGDLSDTVLDGGWTLDVFLDMMKDGDHDLDGDGEMTHKDFHIYARVNTTITAWSHYTGAGQKLSVTSSNGSIELPIGNDASISVMEKCKKIFEGTVGYPSTETNLTVDMFMEDRALFFGNSYSNMVANFRDMDSDFSVIPTPKLNEAQEDYFSYINTWALSGVAVPRDIDDPEMVGLATELLCRLSYRDVRPALYDTVIKVKMARSDKDSELLDIIFDNSYIDFNGIFNIGGTAEVLAYAILGEKEFASEFAAVQDKVQADIDKIMAISEN